MSYRTILTCVNAGPNAASTLSVARRLAQQHDAKLIGLHVQPPALNPTHVRAHYTRQLAEHFARRHEEESRAAEQLFAAAARDLPRHAWETVAVGNPAEIERAFYRRARCADLTVVAQVGEGESIATRPEVLPQELVMQAGRPVIVVPPALSLGTVGQRVLVAWNQSREAARALADSMPMLRKAEQVWVLTIDEHGGSGAPLDARSDRRAAQAVEYLAEHGVAAKPLYDVTGDIEASDIVLSRLSDLTADLLVLGAYGHSRLRELMLGGVTRDLLSHMTVPMLMAH